MQTLPENLDKITEIKYCEHTDTFSFHSSDGSVANYRIDKETIDKEVDIENFEKFRREIKSGEKKVSESTKDAVEKLFIRIFAEKL